MFTHTAASRMADYIPPAARRFANGLLGNSIKYGGPYLSWAAARAVSGGYDDADILARVVNATRRVLSGDADYEQDGVALRGSPPPSDTLAALLAAAALHHGSLSVLDFGGGLGSHYLRWRHWLSPLAQVRWCVVEQQRFAAAGAALFSDDFPVVFATTIDQARVLGPNVVLASSALHYVENPTDTLDELVEVGARVIVIDRTPLSQASEPVILSQHVPKSLGRASYPLWLLPRDFVYEHLRTRYSMLLEFPAADRPIRFGKLHAEHLGSVWLRKS